MTDLEITKLCAEAMGCYPKEPLYGLPGAYKFLLPKEGTDRRAKCYDPLHDDAQAMALVKKFRLSIDVFGKWMVQDKKGNYAPALSQDLNRAICECVAKMQASK